MKMTGGHLKTVDQTSHVPPVLNHSTDSDSNSQP